MRIILPSPPHQCKQNRPETPLGPLPVHQVAHPIEVGLHGHDALLGRLAIQLAFVVERAPVPNLPQGLEKPLPVDNPLARELVLLVPEADRIDTNCFFR